MLKFSLAEMMDFVSPSTKLQNVTHFTKQVVNGTLKQAGYLFFGYLTVIGTAEINLLTKTVNFEATKLLITNPVLFNSLHGDNVIFSGVKIRADLAALNDEGEFEFHSFSNDFNN